MAQQKYVEGTVAGVEGAKMKALDKDFEVGQMNLRRRLLIGSATVKDHLDELDAKVAAEGKKYQGGTYRSGHADDLLLDTLKAPINEVYNKLPGVKEANDHDPALIEFLNKECKMVLEHKDGSFMDHLQFGNEYVRAHMPGYSGRPLMLHSIMGIGNNYMPCPPDKVEKLQNLLTPFEWRHVEAFPAMVRIWDGGKLPEELLGYSPEKLKKIKGIAFRRVGPKHDNKEIYLDADDFWVHLNYQLIHNIDFFPAAFWGEQASRPATEKDDPSLLIFRIYCDELTTVLKRVEKMHCTINFEPGISVKGAIPESCSVARRFLRWSKVSAKIGHTIDYKLHWEEDTARPKL